MRGINKYPRIYLILDAQGIGSVPVVKLERRLGVVEPTIVQQVEVAVKLWLNLS